MATQMKIRRVQESEIDVTGLGAKIEKARRSSDRSLTALCKEADISRNYWYQIEAENIQGALLEETLRKIERVLGVDLGIKF